MISKRKRNKLCAAKRRDADLADHVHPETSRKRKLVLIQRHAMPKRAYAIIIKPIFESLETS